MSKLRLTRGLVFSCMMAGIVILAVQGVSVLAQDDAGPGSVVFASDRTGNYEIYVLDPKTGLSVQLTNDPGNDVEPDLGPDGNTIVFASDRGGDYELYVVKTDGTSLRQITNNLAEDRQPRWQPDGLNAIFVSDVNGQWDMYVVSANGAIVRQLTNDVADERGPGAVSAGSAASATSGASTPVPTQIVIPAQPDAVVTSYRLNVRRNPGEGARIVEVVTRNTELEVVGRYYDNNWIQIQTPKGNLGWVATWLVKLNLDLASVPVVNVQFMAPTPTPTATYTPTVSPTPQMSIGLWATPMTMKPNECATIGWDVEGIKAVYFQSEGVTGHGSRNVCLAATTTYHLRVIRLDDTEENRYITITVTP